MTLQIEKIFLYSRHGKLRTLNFKPGNVNIITGQSKTGKTAIVSIIEYCMGKSTFEVPEEVIRDTVGWYGVVYTMEGTNIIVAKPAPEEGTNSESQAYIEIGKNLSIPKLSRLKPNSNDDGVIEVLSGRIGIGPNIHIPDEGKTRQSLQATIRHTTYYLYQPQNIIANKDVLFYRQHEQFMAQAIKDTLPYFLGSVREDYLELLQDLRYAKREFRLAQKEVQEAEELGEIKDTRAYMLINEAKQVGLISEDANPRSNKEIFGLLTNTLNWTPNQVGSIAGDQLNKLNQELDKYLMDFHELDLQLATTTKFMKLADGYKEELQQQITRLEPVGIINREHDFDTCPICSSQLQKSNSQIANIKHSLQRLERNLNEVEADKPRLENYISELREKKEELRAGIEEKRLAISAIHSENKVAEKIRDKNSRIARVVGRISLFTDTTKTGSDLDLLRQNLDERKKKVDTLTTQLDKENQEGRLLSISRNIDHQMSTWAKNLELEFSKYPFGLDLQNLTVVAFRPDSPFPMKRMGSGENWLGSHLISILALHKHFIEAQRPVPGFLVLDQPTQVYFPDNVYRDFQQNPNPLNENDALAVDRLFKFLFKVCDDLAPNLQLIITEHANLNDKQFQDSLIEDPWKDGRALIPADWLS